MISFSLFCPVATTYLELLLNRYLQTMSTMQFEDVELDGRGGGGGGSLGLLQTFHCGDGHGPNVIQVSKSSFKVTSYMPSSDEVAISRMNTSSLQ